MKKTAFYSLILILCLSFIFRVYGLNKTPSGLYIDEISIATNAYTISQNFSDEYGVFMPFWFKALGEFKLPIYIYVVSIFNFFFGNSYWAVRLPSALAGSLGTLLIFLLTKQLFPKISKKNNFLLPLSSALFWAISPWSLQFSRGGFESNFATTLFLAGIYLLNSVILAKERKIKKIDFRKLIIAGLLLSLSVATYNTFRGFVPLFFIWYVISNFSKIKLDLRQFFSAFFIVTVLSMPIILNQFTKVGFVRVQSESLFEEKNSPDAIRAIGLQLMENIDFNYLFFFGDQNGRHSVRSQGMLLYIQLPLILLGIFYIKDKNFDKQQKFLLAWFILGILPAVVSTPSPHSLRSLIVLPVWTILTALGLYFLVSKVNQKISLAIIKNFIFSFLFFSTIFNFMIYQTEYYTRYRLATALDWGNGNYEAIVYIKDKADDFDEVYITDQLPYHYLAYFMPLSVEIIQQNQEHFAGNLPSFDKFRYFKNAWDIPKTNTSKLVIGPWWNQPRENAQNIFHINLVNGDHLFNIWEENAN